MTQPGFGRHRPNLVVVTIDYLHLIINLRTILAALIRTQFTRNRLQTSAQ